MIVETSDLESKFLDRFEAIAGKGVIEVNDEDGLTAIRRILRKMAGPSLRRV